MNQSGVIFLIFLSICIVLATLSSYIYRRLPEKPGFDDPSSTLLDIVVAIFNALFILCMVQLYVWLVPLIFSQI